ncbi:MAG: hypothetical protein AB7I38_03810 [Dehalococcoidia bacterium]
MSTITPTAPRRADAHLGFESEAERYYGYLSLSDAQMHTEFRGIIRAEHELPEPLRYECALARLQAWLALTPEDARILARAYEQALASFPEAWVADARDVERGVLLNAFSFDEFRELSSVLPWLQADSWHLPSPAEAAA